MKMVLVVFYFAVIGICESSLEEQTGAVQCVVLAMELKGEASMSAMFWVCMIVEWDKKNGIKCVKVLKIAEAVLLVSCSCPLFQKRGQSPNPTTVTKSYSLHSFDKTTSTIPLRYLNMYLKGTLFFSLFGPHSVNSLISLARSVLML